MSDTSCEGQPMFSDLSLNTPCRYSQLNTDLAFSRPSFPVITCDFCTIDPYRPVSTVHSSMYRLYLPFTMLSKA